MIVEPFVVSQNAPRTRDYAANMIDHRPDKLSTHHQMNVPGELKKTISGMPNLAIIILSFW